MPEGRWKYMSPIKIILALLSFPSLAFGVPSKPVVSGTVAHGQAITITGSNFGGKATAAPWVWDNCSGTNVGTLWDGYWPNTGTSAYRVQYQSPIRSVGLPHSNISKYMTGSHGDSGGADDGYNVMVWKNLTSVSYPTTIYWSAYIRLDPSWVFGDDNNLKMFDFSNGSTPYTMNSTTDSNWYIEYNGRFTSATGTGEWHLNDDGGALQNPDANSVSWWWNSAVNPFQNWIKKEYQIQITNQNTGHIKVWENGVLKVDYYGRTDNYTGTNKSLAIGGYARNYGNPSNYRYFADLYLDATASRVILCPGSTWASRGACQNVIPSAWSASSITGAVNQGAFAANDTAYLYVVDAAGDASPASDPITIGSGSSTITCYQDADNDGYGHGVSETVTTCSSGYYIASHFAALTGDEDDNDASVYPGSSPVTGGLMIRAGSTVIGPGATPITAQ